MTGSSRQVDHAKALAEVPLFAGLSRDEIGRVLELSREVSFAAGSVLVDQGDAGTECYLILEGTASVYVRGEYVASSGSGSMVGEMALIDHRPRTATVVADTDVDCLQFDSAAFRVLLDEMPKASERILMILSVRLDRLDEL